jgi:putative transposase
LAAIDFTTVEVWTKGGLVTFYLLFVMEIATRRVHFAGCTTNPDGIWMKQMTRNLIDCEDGFLIGKRYLLMDRDTKFTEAFRSTLKNEGVKSVVLPTRSPNLNAHQERFHRSLKDECLSRMIFFEGMPQRCSRAALGNQIIGMQVAGKIDTTTTKGRITWIVASASSSPQVNAVCAHREFRAFHDHNRSDAMFT